MTARDCVASVKRWGAKDTSGRALMARTASVDAGRLEGIAGDEVIDHSLYQDIDAGPGEAPTIGYAKFFHERGHRLALPWFADAASPMAFRLWQNPYGDDELVRDPFIFGARQPRDDAELLTPDVVFVPLVGFTAACDRLGQGGGYYDRWLGAHPASRTIGLAWDCQLCEALPVEPHDRALDAVITPTRIYTRASG